MVGRLDVTFGQSSLVEEAVTGWCRAGLARIGESALLPRPRARGPRRGGLGKAVSGESENRSLPLGLGDGVSGESEISAETSFVYSVGSVLRV